MTEIKNKRRPDRPTPGRPSKLVRRLTDKESIQEFTKPLVDLVNSFGLHVNPVVHYNGPSPEAAIMVVDFGSPLVPVRLTNEQSAEMAAVMRRLTKELYQNEVNVRIGTDHQSGVHWTALV